MRLRAVLVAVLMASSCHLSLYGWSAEGHRAVAIIAQQLLQQSGQFASIQSLLGNLSLADIATYPDEVREAERDHSFQMSLACASVFPNPPSGTESWHFINIHVSISNPTHNDVDAACPDKCVITQINAFGQILGDTTQPKLSRLKALSFVVHFIGDVRQPLHDAVRDKDAGGNAEQIRINGVKTSLHHAWDEPLVSAIDGDPQSLATALAPQIQSAQAESKAQPEDWALEAFKVAGPDAYVGIPPARGQRVVATLSVEYQQTAENIIRQQIARAGVRLAQFIADKTANAAAGTGHQEPKSQNNARHG